MLRSLLLSAAILGAAEAMRAGVSSRPLRAVAARPSGVAMGLTFDESKAMAGDPNMKNYRKLSDALKEADVERRKEEEAAMAALKAEEDKRNRRKKKMEVMRAIPDSAPAGKVSDFMYRDGVTEVLEKLDNDMIGLQPVKQRVRDIASLLVIDKMRRKLGLDTSIPSLHMCFTGAPGTGKTTVAMKMGQILQRMGYCRHGGVVVATRDDLVGQYVGHTAPKTKEMIKKAFGGILLIDEAYYLYNAANDKDYGQESIEILLNVMENQKDDLIVTLAGYKDRMDKFFSYIPGMSSRIGNHIDFPNYEPDELVEIAKVMARELEYTFADDAIPVLREYVAKRMTLPFFSNARTVRNAIDRARMRQANRLFIEKLDPSSDGSITPEELQMFTKADMPTAAELEALGESAIVE
ncbi:hypothetical protein KFE25_000361 [Diacronema lutheri]|uniref:AAA+ ATPase domain-containing protein n=1 Tax=Diacronema lutheri TaxID=2081491 RepID=A0A7R9YN37_DIALT|nr:hypothetical protein KFE25_000361 [Diacronema lutheri]|mmetsp:Transcript_4614/g.14231  ORF Transcript_4614/g.14231 Transcript_4614/m.14231 type:complete len:408 (+) Transcript_4614:44-1267(+)